MTSQEPRQRAEKVFAAIERKIDGWGPSGSYPFAEIEDGLRFWVTVPTTRRELQFGMQFRAQRSDLAERLWPEFQRCGFKRRPPLASGILTFYRLLEWNDEGSVDRTEAMLVRRAIEGILGVDR